MIEGVWPVGTRIEAPVGNYYGKPYVERDSYDGAFVFGVEQSGDDPSEVDVSAEFAMAWAREFGPEPTRVEDGG